MFTTAVIRNANSTSISPYTAKYVVLFMTSAPCSRDTIITKRSKQLEIIAEYVLNRKHIVRDIYVNPALYPF